MKTLKIFLMASAILLITGLNQVNAQKVVHWLDFPWGGDLYIDCPNSAVTVISGTLYQDFVIHLDKDGNWTKINAQYDKSLFTANTGEVFTVFGAAALGMIDNPNCFRETIQLHGDRGSKFTLITNIRSQDGKLVMEKATFHCGK
jgi:hypothetical protein